MRGSRGARADLSLVGPVKPQSRFSGKEIHMKNFVGGLFKQEDVARAARRALREAGFSQEDVTILARKPQNAPAHADRVQAPQVGRAALLGAILLGVLGGLFGLLAGLGFIPIPGVDAATYRISTGFVLTSVAAGLIAGGVTGIILGSAFRLFVSKDKAAITDQGIKRGGLLVVAD